MLRIAMIGSKGVPASIGGVERHVEELSHRLATAGFTVTVYARAWYVDRAPWTERTHRGIRVVVLPSLHTKHLDAVTHTLLATLHAMRERAEVYHFHGVGPALLAWLPRIFRSRARTIVTFHCVDRRHAKWGAFARAVLACGEWAACRFPHETIVVGQTLATYCADQYARQTTYIPNGVAVPQALASPAEASAALAPFGLAKRQYLLVVSRLVAHKEIETVITAYRQLTRECPAYRDLKLAVVGAPSFTDVYEDVLRMAAGGDPNIVFLGQRSGETLDALFANCLAFTHASRSEGLPIVVLEAAAAGAVAVVSDIPEHREVIGRIGGVCFRTGDSRDLACKFEALLAARDHLPRLGSDARAAVLRHYNWDSITAQTAARYRDLVDGAATRERAVPFPCARAII